MPTDERSLSTLLAEAQTIQARLADAIEHLSLLLLRAKADGAAPFAPDQPHGR